MYVCVCNAVTDSQVLRAAEEGVRNLRGLQAHLGIALECGRCASYAHGLLREAGKTQAWNTPSQQPQCGENCCNCPRAKEKNHERRQEDAAIPQ